MCSIESWVCTNLWAKTQRVLWVCVSVCVSSQNTYSHSAYVIHTIQSLPHTPCIHLNAGELSLLFLSFRASVSSYSLTFNYSILFNIVYFKCDFSKILFFCVWVLSHQQQKQQKNVIHVEPHMNAHTHACAREIAIANDWARLHSYTLSQHSERNGMMKEEKQQQKKQGKRICIRHTVTFVKE